MVYIATKACCTVYISNITKSRNLVCTAPPRPPPAQIPLFRKSSRISHGIRGNADKIREQRPPAPLPSPPFFSLLPPPSDMHAPPIMSLFLFSTYGDKLLTCAIWYFNEMNEGNPQNYFEL